MSRTIPQTLMFNLDIDIQKTKKRKIIIPHYLSQKLAYYVGYLQGDGCLESNFKRLAFVDENRVQMEFINSITYDLFNTSGTIRECNPPLSKKPVYHLEIGSVDIHKFLREVFKIPIGRKRNLSIPHQMYAHQELLCWYLRGLFDADGTLPKDAMAVKQMFIDITLKDKSFIEEIRDALKSLGVITLQPYKRLAKSPHSDFISETWELRIRRRADMISFINKIGFFAECKAKRLISLRKRLNAPVAQSGY